MTRDQITAVFQHVQDWPEEDRAELAQYAREIEARRTGKYVLDEDERAAIEDARGSELVSDDDVQALWKRCGPE